MKKFTVLVLVCAFALVACQPAPSTNNFAPAVDIAGTVNAIANTAIAQTQTAQPSPTIQNTVTATSTPVVEPSTTNTPLVNTDTPQPNLTTTPATATSGALNPTATFTPTTVPGLPTLTPTLGVLTYGTLPPANRPYIYASLINKSQRQTYISLQVVTDQGYTIIEYPVKRIVNVKIPVGSYTYVVWVGGRQIVGYFNVSKHDEVNILIYKDKVVINKNYVSYP